MESMMKVMGMAYVMSDASVTAPAVPSFTMPPMRPRASKTIAPELPAAENARDFLLWAKLAQSLEIRGEAFSSSSG